LDTLTDGERRDAAMSDETRQFSPFDDDDDRTRGPESHPNDGPRSGDSPLDDRTAQMPSADADETVMAPRPDSTAVMPATDVAAQQEWNGAWSGRAEVRPPLPGREEYMRTEWSTVPPPEPRGKWWMPIVVGIVGLILLGAIGWGVYLIAQNTDDTDVPPATTPSVAAPESTAPVTTEPTTTPPTTTPTTTEPTEPAEVTVPALTGLSQQEAQRALARRGLSYRLIFRPSDAAAGTVIDSDPAEGQEVPADTQVTLVIATKPTTPATTTTAPDGQPDED
jgi:hypothetical protein